MKQQAQLIGKLPNFIFLVIVIAVLFLIIAVPIKNLYSSTGNVKAVQQWVWQNSMEEEYTAHIFSEVGYPPISELAKPLVIDSPSDLNSEATYEDITESIYDCGKAFYFGQDDYNFLSKLDVANDGYVFCYPCRRIEFSDSVRSSGQNIVGLSNYMSTHSPYSGGKPTFAEMLKEMNPKLFKTFIPKSEDIITTDEHKYIFYLATYKIDRTKAGCLVENGIAQYTGNTAASMITGGINILGSSNTYISAFTDSEYTGMILIAESKKLSQLCNYHTAAEKCKPITTYLDTKTPSQWDTNVHYDL